MCVIFAVINPNPNYSKYKFFLAMNRDESFLRDTFPLQYWPEYEIFCGKDTLKGGTWLGINKKGWFVAITNVRNGTKVYVNNDPSISSRGDIPFKLLSQNTFDPIEWESIIKALNCDKFNVIFGDLSDDPVKVFSYSSESEKLIELPINDDSLTIFSLANGSIQDSNWFKQQKGEELIQALLPEVSKESIFDILKDVTRGSEDSEDFKNFPIFVKPINFRGTVSSSLIFLDFNDKINFIEKSWNLDQSLKNEAEISFFINK